VPRCHTVSFVPPRIVLAPPSFLLPVRRPSFVPRACDNRPVSTLFQVTYTHTRARVRSLFPLVGSCARLLVWLSAFPYPPSLFPLLPLSCVAFPSGIASWPRIPGRETTPSNSHTQVQLGSRVTARTVLPSPFFLPSKWVKKTRRTRGLWNAVMCSSSGWSVS
jgi:hypothetical protein